MADALVERAKQCACFAAVTFGRARFVGGTNQLVQHLRVALKEIQKFSQRFGVLKQSITPLLSQRVQPLVFLIQALDSLKLMPKVVGLNTPHQLADKLHLPAPRLMLLGRLVAIERQRVFQVRVRKLNPFKLFVRQLGKRLAECLQRQHVSFFRTFRGQSFRLECPIIIS